MYLPNHFVWGTQTFLMGVINVTPDSFSGDGLGQKNDLVANALGLATKFVEAGTHVLDVGGESTRPGNRPITVSEELDRVIPVVQALADHVSIPISVDTSKSIVADAALDAGASIVNDIWGLRQDPELANIIYKHKSAVILMQNSSQPLETETDEMLGSRYKSTLYNDFLPSIRSDLEMSIAIARNANIDSANIIIDPGIGFGKSVSQNIRLINELDYFTEIGYPILIGPSRKSFIGYTLNLPVEERLEGTAAAISVGIVRGADMVRVHDVKPISRIVRMTDSLVRNI